MTNIPSIPHLQSLLARKPASLHARTTSCPNGCTEIGGRTFEPLSQKNLSEVHAVKYCTHCKRKFYYLRTDTKEGRAIRARLWQWQRRGEPKYKLIDVLQEMPGTNVVWKKQAPMTAAERMRNMRARRKAENA